VIESFEEDDFTLWYEGVFKEFFTQGLIELCEQALQERDGRRSRNKASYLLAESFQNIVKHGKTTGQSDGLFAIRIKERMLSIYSSNSITDQDAFFLNKRMEKINSLTREELEAFYLSKLNQGNLSDKGGAGLGHIEMVRKSGRPLQYIIEPANEEHAFNVQIDMCFDKENKCPIEAISINDTYILQGFLSKEGVILFYKGEFTQQTVLPLLGMINENTVDSSRFRSLYRIAVELFQNISKHGKQTNNQQMGWFSLQKKDDNFIISTANKIEAEKVEPLAIHLNKLKEMNSDQLDDFYRVQLKENIDTDRPSASVGLIDIARISKEMEFTMIDQGEDFMYMMSVTL